MFLDFPNTSTQRVLSNTPEGIYNRIHDHYPMIYIHREGNMSYRGYDVSASNPNKPIAEIILLNDRPVQIRYLSARPYWSDSINFGDF